MTNSEISFDKIYFVYGAEFLDFTFKKGKPETYVEFGPFYSETQAYECWKENMWLNVDNALYKLFIDVYDTTKGV